MFRFGFRNIVVATATLAFAACAFARAAAPVSSPPQQIFSATTGDFPKSSTANVHVYTGSLQPGDSTFWHVHSSPPIVYVESGTGTWEYRNGRQSDARSAGHVMLEPANVAVRLANHGTTVVRVIMVSITKPGDPFFRPAR